MVCRACGDTTFDATGTCLSCGTPSHIPEELSSPAVAVAEIAATPLPDTTPRANRRMSQPIHDKDPAATNPGSGVFCGRCGSAVDVQSDYCGICGNPLKESTRQRLQQSRALAAHSPARMAAQALLAAADTRPPLAHYTPARSSFLLIVLGVTVVILILSVALGVLVLHQR